MSSGWNKFKLIDAIQFNPKEIIKKGDVVKKVAMEKLEPFNRKISGYEEVAFTSGTKFRNGDTLLARITPCLENGKTAQVDILDKDEVGFGSTEYIVLREKLGVTDNDFIYYLSISPEFRNVAIKAMNGSSGRQRVQKDVLENSEFTLPPLYEQKAIAKVLSDLDEKIETNNKINKTLEEMAQAVFKEWFVDFEFPNEECKPYKSSGGEMVESEMGMIPKGWEQSTLEEVSRMSAGGDKPKSFSKNATKEKAVPIYSNGTDNEGLYGYTDKAKIFEESITVSARGTIGYVCLRQQPYFPIVRLVSVIPRENIITSKYLYFYLKLLNISGTGTTQQQLTVPDFKRTKIWIPEYKVTKQFTEVTKDIFKKIENGKSENMKLVQIRDTLLPKLMSGEIRVPLE